MSRTRIPRDACVLAHISLMHNIYVIQVIVIHVSPGVWFPISVEKIYNVAS